VVALYGYIQRPEAPRTMLGKYVVKLTRAHTR